MRRLFSITEAVRRRAARLPDATPAFLPLTAFLVGTLLLVGCGPPPLPSADLPTVKAELDQIPMPVKGRYLAVKTLETWQNPYLTVQGNMLTLHVLMADANTSTLGSGGVLRPVGARRQDLNIRTSDLPTALGAVPSSAWPYGRVVAVEEAHDAPASARPQLRRNMEAAIRSLGDLGVVVYEWQDGGAGLR